MAIGFSNMAVSGDLDQSSSGSVVGMEGNLIEKGSARAGRRGQLVLENLSRSLVVKEKRVMG